MCRETKNQFTNLYDILVFLLYIICTAVLPFKCGSTTQTNGNPLLHFPEPYHKVKLHKKLLYQRHILGAGRTSLAAKTSAFILF